PNAVTSPASGARFLRMKFIPKRFKGPEQCVFTEHTLIIDNNGLSIFPDRGTGRSVRHIMIFQQRIDLIPFAPETPSR
ncbi:hypothetical protein, partial [Klebsiella pneumoniae]